MPLTSMTGFAELAGEAEGAAWVFEARSVNGRGLDLRVRLPEGMEALEAVVRAAVGTQISRGSVSVALRLGQGARSALPRLNPEALDAAILAAVRVGESASSGGLDLAPMTAADLLGLRGVLETESRLPAENPVVRATLAAQVGALVAALSAARVAEGAALERILAAQIDRIAGCASAARGERQAETLRARLDALLGATTVVDEARLAQELALLAVKADVTEELDRLNAHVAAVRALIAGDGPVGRKLDFLTQEFNREANTLCSKAQSTELTAIGLDLKVVIDQMREQVQNVE